VEQVGSRWFRATPQLYQLRLGLDPPQSIAEVRGSTRGDYGSDSSTGLNAKFFRAATRGLADHEVSRCVAGAMALSGRFFLTRLNHRSFNFFCFTNGRDAIGRSTSQNMRGFRSRN